MKTDDPFAPLDNYEANLIESIESDEFEPKPIVPKRKKLLEDSAAKTIKEIETKRQISIKISERDLICIRQRANAVSIPYQNIIQSLLRKYASGEIKLEI
jgi:predicted DNA binding CopG/RHH family protein